MDRMTDEQLDELQDQASIVAERAFWDERHADIDDTALKDLIADYRRLRAENERLGTLEIAVRALLPIDGKGSAVLPGIYTTPAERAALAAIGRLLEEPMKEEDWVKAMQRIPQAEYRRLITQEWPDKEAEGER